MEYKNGTTVYTLKGHTSTVFSVAFSPNDNLLASGKFSHNLGSGDQNIILWNVEQGT